MNPSDHSTSNGSGVKPTTNSILSLHAPTTTLSSGGGSSHPPGADTSTGAYPASQASLESSASSGLAGMQQQHNIGSSSSQQQQHQPIHIPFPSHDMIAAQRSLQQQHHHHHHHQQSQQQQQQQHQYSNMNYGNSGGGMTNHQQTNPSVAPRPCKYGMSCPYGTRCFYYHDESNTAPGMPMSNGYTVPPQQMAMNMGGAMQSQNGGGVTTTSPMQQHMNQQQTSPSSGPPPLPTPASRSATAQRSSHPGSPAPTSPVSSRPPPSYDVAASLPPPPPPPPAAPPSYDETIRSPNTRGPMGFSRPGSSANLDAMASTTSPSLGVAAPTGAFPARPSDHEAATPNRGTPNVQTVPGFPRVGSKDRLAPLSPSKVGTTNADGPTSPQRFRHDPYSPSSSIVETDN